MYFWCLCLFKKRNIILIIYDNEFLAHWNRSSTCQSDIGESNSQEKILKVLRVCYTMYKYILKSKGNLQENSSFILCNDIFKKLLQACYTTIENMWSLLSKSAYEKPSMLACVMKPAQENIEKIDQRLRIQPLRGGNLLYIT